MTSSNPTPPEQATSNTVSAEWWTGDQLAAYLGYAATRYASQWFRRHQAAGHFQDYAEPCRPLAVNRTEGSDPRGNRWLFWAPACVEVRERSIRGTSRLA